MNRKPPHIKNIFMPQEKKLDRYIWTLSPAAMGLHVPAAERKDNKTREFCGEREKQKEEEEKKR